MINHEILTSLRADRDCVQITATITFIGPGTDATDYVTRRFTDPLKASMKQLADETAVALERVREEQDAVLATVLDEALARVDMTQHAAIRERLGLSRT